MNDCGRSIATWITYRHTYIYRRVAKYNSGLLQKGMYILDEPVLCKKSQENVLDSREPAKITHWRFICETLSFSIVNYKRHPP